MNNIWQKLFKTSALYLFGTVIAKLVSFFMLPLYTEKIPTDVYGMYDIVVAYAAIVVPLVGVNCWQGMLRFLAEEKEVTGQNRVVAQGWIMMLISMLLLTAGYWVFCLFVDFSCKMLVYLYFLAQMLQYFYLYTARGYQRNTVYAVSGIISAVVVAVVSLICVYLLNLRLEALYWAQIISLLAQVVYMELDLHLVKKIDFRLLDRKMLKSLYRFCFPESVGTIFNWLLSSINRLIIVAVLGYAANGIYAISNKFLAILNVFMTAFVLSFQEVLYSADTETREQAANTVLDKFAKLAGAAVAVILIGTSVVYPLFISGDYTEGYSLIPVFYLYFMMSGVTWILSSVVSATKQTQITLYEKIIIGIVNFGLMACLITPMGLSSSPVSLLVAETIGIAVFKILLKRIAGFTVKIPVRYLVLDMLMIGAASIVFFINNLWLNLGVLAVAAVAFLVIFRKLILSLLHALTAFVKERKANS